MKKLDFRFLTNKLFLSGLITGIVISAFAFILIIGPKYPAQDKGKIKGTMAGTTYVPAVGDIGTIQSVGTQCNGNYSDVIFDEDPDHSVFRCHSDPASVGMQVEIAAVNSGQFCSGGGIFLSLVPVGL
jgi:hypothetical protein